MKFINFQTIATLEIDRDLQAWIELYCFRRIDPQTTETESFDLFHVEGLHENFTDDAMEHVPPEMERRLIDLADKINAAEIHWVTFPKGPVAFREMCGVCGATTTITPFFQDNKQKGTGMCCECGYDEWISTSDLHKAEKSERIAALEAVSETLSLVNLVFWLRQIPPQ